ncbi:MAG: chemotaxis protein CheD [Desulfobacteraceae bacterium]|nr:MAG: chemotaxis protein CheD [Desulfobacteraceae bacterium]
MGMSDMKISKDPGDILVTYSLGSCVGVTAYDPAAKVGGLLHLMLPDSSLNSGKAQSNPFVFADTGVPAMIRALTKSGALKNRMKIVVAGGAQILDPAGPFKIGRRNFGATRECLKKLHLFADYEEVGGHVDRTLRLIMETGSTLIQTSMEKFQV